MKIDNKITLNTKDLKNVFLTNTDFPWISILINKIITAINRIIFTTGNCRLSGLINPIEHVILCCLAKPNVNINSNA
jgi:hypothetical protein